MKNKKIKVNNGQELIAKAREYKDSGKEWKLQERYIEMPTGQENSKKYLEWGIIINNGKEAVDIRSAGNNVCSKSGPNDEINVRSELEQLFPEAHGALFASGLNKDGTRNDKYRQSILDCSSFKIIKENNSEYNLHRYLVAENSWHLSQILYQYVRDNENKIYQSTNPHFSGWVEIVDSQDGNMYFYVGERNASGGREIKIGLKKEKFYDKSNRDCYSAEQSLEVVWGLSTIGRPRTPYEQKEYYSSSGGLEEYWQTVNRHWEQTCRTTLEALRNELIKAQEFWDNEPNEEVRIREIKAVNQKIGKINRRLEDMRKNYPDWYNNYDKDCPECGRRMCCDKEGHTCRKVSNKQGMTNSSKNNGQLTTSLKPTSDTNSTTSTSKKSLSIYIGLAISAFILGGCFVYFLIQRKGRLVSSINNKEKK